jgi:hypothetical protein
MSDEVQLPEDLKAASALPKREPRLNVMLMATVQQARRTGPTTHRVRDLATRGARIDKAEKLRVGETIQISIGAAQAIAATVHWVCQGSAGLSFEDAVDIAAARKRVAAPPKPIASPKLKVAPTVPTAGWYSQLKDPYRR